MIIKLNDKEIVEIMTTNTEQTISGIKEFPIRFRNKQ